MAGKTAQPGKAFAEQAWWPEPGGQETMEQVKCGDAHL